MNCVAAGREGRRLNSKITVSILIRRRSRCEGSIAEVVKKCGHAVPYRGHVKAL